jgi:hypothetical protein
MNAPIAAISRATIIAVPTVTDVNLDMAAIAIVAVVAIVTTIAAVTIIAIVTVIGLGLVLVIVLLSDIFMSVFMRLIQLSMKSLVLPGSQPLLVSFLMDLIQLVVCVVMLILELGVILFVLGTIEWMSLGRNGKAE